MGERGQGDIGLGGSAVFYPQFVLGSAKKLKFKTWKSFEPNPQNSFVWCHVRGNVWDVWGKEIKETLAWEEVLFFYPQFVLGSAKEWKFKTWKSFEPNPKIASYGAMFSSGAMCGMYGGKEVKGNVGLGGSAVFLHSARASVRKGI